MREERDLAIDAQSELSSLHREALKRLTEDNAESRRQALDALDPADPVDFKLIESALLADKDRRVRKEAAVLLSFGQFPEAIPALTQALEDSDPDVIAAATESLSWFAHEAPSITEAIRPLTNHASGRVREAAKTALEMME